MSDGSERITRTSIHFHHPFKLASSEKTYPPGTYEIETVEERLDALSFLAYRRVMTTMAPIGPDVAGCPRHLDIVDPADLKAALDRDAAAQDRSSRTSNEPAGNKEADS